jgi:hypothetical protein
MNILKAFGYAAAFFFAELWVVGMIHWGEGANRWKPYFWFDHLVFLYLIIAALVMMIVILGMYMYPSRYKNLMSGMEIVDHWASIILICLFLGFVFAGMYALTTSKGAGLFGSLTYEEVNQVLDRSIIAFIVGFMSGIVACARGCRPTICAFLRAVFTRELVAPRAKIQVKTSSGKGQPTSLTSRL